MANKLARSGVLVLGSFWFLAGCGGIGTRDCPSGVCAPVCTGDTFAAEGGCVPFTACGPGSYLVAAGTPVSDQVCEFCPSGTFTRLENSPYCSPWSICPAGMYVSNVPSSTVNRVCAACGAGTLTTGVNQSICTSTTQCPPGTVQTASGTPISAPVCTPCREGEHCPGGENPAASCGGDKWDDDGDPATACVPKTVCGAGTYVQRLGSSISDRACAPCTAGAFSSTINASSCRTWDDCESGTYVANLPTSTSNRLCVGCPMGTYTTEMNQSACLLANDCPAGTVEALPGSATAPAVCTPCQKGEYCAGGGGLAKPCANETWDHDGNPVTACVAWSSCSSGNYVSLAGSATNDRECAACPASTFSALPNSPQCFDWSDCPLGTYIAAPPTSRTDRLCNTCDASSYSSQLNAITCSPRSECTSYTTFLSAPASPSADTSCSPCGVRGCPKYCSATWACIECLTEDDCSTGTLCVDSVCAPVECGGPPPYFVETFASANANWWTLDRGWSMGPAVDWVGGSVKAGTYQDPTVDHSPGKDNMIAGVMIGANAPQEVTGASRYLTSAVIDISEGDAPVFLEFYHWLNSDDAFAMTNTVEVYDGLGWVTLFSSSEASGAIAERSWQRSVYDVTAYRNTNFRVRFGYAVHSFSVESVSSWNLDDVRIANAPSCIAL